MAFFVHVSITDEARSDEREWREFEGTLATSHLVAKYGGVRLAPQALQQMADALNAGQIPMLAQHDPRRGLRVRRLSAAVVDLPDGEQAVRFACLVHPDDVGLVEGMHAMSFATSELIGSVQGPNPESGSIELRADAAVFSDEVIARACEQMCTVGQTHGFRLFQFAGPDEARIILDIAYSIVITLGCATSSATARRALGIPSCSWNWRLQFGAAMCGPSFRPAIPKSLRPQWPHTRMPYRLWQACPWRSDPCSTGMHRSVPGSQRLRAITRDGRAPDPTTVRERTLPDQWRSWGPRRCRIARRVGGRTGRLHTARHRSSSKEEGTGPVYSRSPDVMEVR